MNRARKLGIPVLALLVSVSALTLAPAPAPARQGFYLGGGLATQSVSGGLDGESLFSAGSTGIAAGKLSSGEGLAFLIGYGFTPVLSFEYLFASTRHTATHTKLDIGSKATLESGLIGLRINGRPAANVEINARAGLATGAATYEKYGLHLITPKEYDTAGEVQFSGSGIGYALGTEISFDKVGLGVNYARLHVAFNKARTSAAAGGLSNKLNAVISQLSATATYYFR